MFLPKCGLFFLPHQTDTCLIVFILASFELYIFHIFIEVMWLEIFCILNLVLFMNLILCYVCLYYGQS